MNSLLKTSLAAIVFFLIIYLIWSLIIKKSGSLSNCRSGTEELSIPTDKLAGNSHTNNYSYSVWFYVSDWSYGLDREKVLIRRGSASGLVNPKIVFSKFENNIEIQVDTYPAPSVSSGPESLSDGPGPLVPPDPLGPGGIAPDAPPHGSHTCMINNFPLQRWVNLIVSLNNRTMDVYLNGKLVRTCILPAPANIDPTAPVVLTPDGGFMGWTSNAQYFANALNPQEAYNIYAGGPRCSGGNLFDAYKLRIQYLVNNQEEASITI